MDVHAPHEPVHTWRDFVTHLTIVTIGLFIALSLEALVEYAHHRHLVKEARENIRAEIKEDQEAAKQDLDILQKNIDQQNANIAAIHGLQDHSKDFHGSVKNTMSFQALDDAAWRTARDTGALGYMPYNEVQRYSDIYMMETLINNTAIDTGKLDFEAAAPFEMGISPDKLPAEEYLRLLHDNANVKIQLSTLRQFVQQFETQCGDELKN